MKYFVLFYIGETPHQIAIDVKTANKNAQETMIAIRDKIEKQMGEKINIAQVSKL